MIFLVSDITYFKKHAEKPDLHVIKIGKFSALDFYDFTLTDKKIVVTHLTALSFYLMFR
jgi:hypothetical protein